MILLLSAALMNAHLAVLPFHSRAENACRGGIYCAVCWAAFASLIVSAVAKSSASAAGAAGAEQAPWRAYLHWTLIAAVPLVFAGGVVAVKLRRHRVSRAIDRLRRQWQPGDAGAGRRHSLQAAPSGLQSVGVGSAAAGSRAGNPHAVGGGGGLFDHFFDRDGAAGRSFESSRQALLVMRVLLYRRVRADVPFFLYLVQVGPILLPACERTQNSFIECSIEAGILLSENGTLSTIEVLSPPSG